MSEKSKEQARATIEALKKRKHIKEYREYIKKTDAYNFRQERIDKALKKKRNQGKRKDWIKYE